MRVHELAKVLNLSSKDLLVKLKELKISAKAHSSTLDADSVNRIRKALTAKKPVAAKLKPAPPKLTVSRSAAPGRPGGGAKPASASALTAAAPKSTPAAKFPAKPTTAPRSSGSTPAKIAEPTTARPMTPPARPVTAPSTTRSTVHTAVVAPSAPKAAASVQAPPAPAKPKEPAAAPASTSAAVVTDASSATATLPTTTTAPPAPARQLSLRFPITVKDLAAKMEVKGTDLIKTLIQHGVFASIVQPLDEATATKAAQAFGFDLLPEPTPAQQLLQLAEPDPAKLVPRGPVVTFMGHVDHGKTSLLDAIRQAKVAEKEAGGITQHIGAYEVAIEKGHVTFLDTPGHEAFSALRARGANVTDIVVLVVAADDGVMPQTIEAIDHAKAAGVPIVVAINKMDKPEANPQKIKQQLTQYELISEDWGGKTIMVSVSARTRQGIDQLLEMLLLEAELLELRADPTIPAYGVVIEAKQTRDRGPVATLLIQQGTLRIGDSVLIGAVVGRVRAMTNDRGHRIKEAGPGKPVEILGLPEVPRAGDRCMVVDDEKLARQIAEQRKEQQEQRTVAPPKRITLEELHSQIAEGKLKELRLIVKADVQGSLEAIVQSLQKLDTEKEEVQFRILHTGVGDISESDVILAAASDAIIVGFHVGIEPKVQVLAATEGVDVHIYHIIYELVGAIKAAIEGLLEPTIEETFLGRAEIRKLFQVSKAGVVAGCMVIKGSIRRDCTMRVVRGRDRVGETKIASLKRVKDDVREVQEGVECGILLGQNPGLQVGDLLEAWELKKVARKLA